MVLTHRTQLRNSQGFTLIELLIVILIIGILTAMLIGGFAYVQRSARRHATRSTMQVLQSLYGSLDADNGTTMLNTAVYTQIDTLYSLPSNTAAPLPAPADVSINGNVNSASGRFGLAVCQPPGQPPGVTQVAMGMMRRIPSNQQVMTQSLVLMAALTPTGSSSTGPLDPPVAVDGWGNPILYVPPAGLSGVLVGGVTLTITAPGGVGFFASAGPDGNFGGSVPSPAQPATDATYFGDDNVYSFEP